MMTTLSKSQKRLLIVLALVLGYAVFDVVKNRDEYLSFYFDQNEKAQSRAPQKHVSKAPARSQSGNKAEYLQSWGRDPFQDPGLVRSVFAQPKQKTALVLRAISRNAGNSVVMINDKILEIGDSIEGYRVVGIEPNQVVLTKGGDTKTLRLK